MDLIPNKNKTTAQKISAVRQNILGLNSSRGQILASKNLENIGRTLFKAAISLLILCIIAGGVFYSLSFQAKRGIKQAESKASSLSASLREGKAADFRNFVRQIEGFKKSLEKRIYTSNLFSEIEKSTVVGVLWNALQVDVFSGSCKLSGKAESYSMVAKQVVALKNADVSGVSFEDIKLNKGGGVSFDASFVFGSDLKQKKQDNE